MPLVMWVTSAESLPRALVETLVSVRTTLVEQPFQYLPNVGDRRLDIFSLVTDGADPKADYEGHRKAANRGRPFALASTWVELLDAEPSSVVLSARAYEEISEMRFWLHDAIVLRWAQQCAGWSKSPVSIDTFEVTGPEPRNLEVVPKLKRLYESLGLVACIYSQKALSGRWDLDHVLPVSRFPVNYFWNLLPADPRVNNEKRARLPVLLEPLRARYRAFVERCVSSQDELVQAHLRASYREYFQQGDVPESRDAVDGVCSLFESSYARLEQAGVDIWVPMAA